MNPSNRLIQYKLVYTPIRNEQGQFVRYKIRCVVQGFNKCHGVAFDQTYSPIMDCTSFWYLLATAVQLSHTTRLLNVVPAYEYGEFNNDIYIMPPPDFFPSTPAG